MRIKRSVFLSEVVFIITDKKDNIVLVSNATAASTHVDHIVCPEIKWSPYGSSKKHK